MCGIVGIIPRYKSGLLKWHIEQFAELLFADQLRGIDGTGFFYDTDDGAIVCKAPVAATNFLGYKEVEDCFTEAAKISSFIVGHNRAATKGNKIWKDTHPFREGPITLVHNGTLNTHKGLADVDVDSHAICVSFAEKGYIETLKQLDGAFALVWYNSDKGTLHLCRNNQRPLHLIETSSCFIISSEAALGVWIAERHNTKVLAVHEVESGQLYTFNREDMKDFTKEKVDFKPAGVFHYSGYFGKKVKKSGKAGSDGNSPSTNEKNYHRHPIRMFGHEVTFSPRPLQTPKPMPETAICYDHKRKQSFLLGQVHGEVGTEFRYYGKEKTMRTLCLSPFLKGTITSTIMQGTKVIYIVHQVEAVEKPKIVSSTAVAIPLCEWCFTELTSENTMEGTGNERICKGCGGILERHSGDGLCDNPRVW